MSTSITPPLPPPSTVEPSMPSSRTSTKPSSSSNPTLNTNATASTISKTLTLLKGPSPEHILAGLTILSKLKPSQQPVRAEVLKALGGKGGILLCKLLNSGVNRINTSITNVNVNGDGGSGSNGYIELVLYVVRYLITADNGGICEENVEKVFNLSFRKRKNNNNNKEKENEDIAASALIQPITTLIKYIINGSATSFTDSEINMVKEGIWLMNVFISYLDLNAKDNIIDAFGVSVGGGVDVIGVDVITELLLTFQKQGSANDDNNNNNDGDNGTIKSNIETLIMTILSRTNKYTVPSLVMLINGSTNPEFSTGLFLFILDSTLPQLLPIPTSSSSFSSSSTPQNQIKQQLTKNQVKALLTKTSKTIRKLLLSSLRLPHTPLTSRIRQKTFEIVSQLFSNYGGGWAVDEKDAKGEGGEVKAFVRCVVGEVRFGLGEVLGFFENESNAKDGSKDGSGSGSKRLQELSTAFNLNADVVLMCTKYLIDLIESLDSEEAEEAEMPQAKKPEERPLPAWKSLSFETIMHVKASLDDAIDSITQLLTSLPHANQHQNPTAETNTNNANANTKLPESLKKILLKSVKVLGAWYCENEVSGSVHDRSNLSSAFVNAVNICAAHDGHSLVDVLPALSKIFSCGEASEDEISELILFDTSVVDVFTKHLSKCSHIHGDDGVNLTSVMWITDTIECCCSHLTPKALQTLSSKVGDVLVGCVNSSNPNSSNTSSSASASSSANMMYILRTWYFTMNLLELPRLNDNVSKAVQKSCELILLNSTIGSEGESGNVYNEVKEAIRSNMPLFELTCKSSKVYEKMLSKLN